MCCGAFIKAVGHQEHIGSGDGEHGIQDDHGKPGTGNEPEIEQDAKDDGKEQGCV